MIFEKQNYQQECIANILDLLKNYDFKRHDAANLKACFSDFYAANPALPHKITSSGLNVDILMETGTGKTFTYLNLIFELHKNFRQNKFIIFVPRKAILESVRQNIELTKHYFYTEFGLFLKPYFYSENAKSAIVNHYIHDTEELSVLVLTNSAIDKEKNILHKQDEGLFNLGSVFENIINLKPLVIIDEPHLLKGSKFSARFNDIKTLYFRFGATFPSEADFKLSNLAFCLDSKASFKQYLVKKIWVDKLHSTSTAPHLLSTDSKKKSAKISFVKSGVELVKEFKKDDDLSEFIPNATITKVQKDRVFLSNNEILNANSGYELTPAEITALISRAIDTHFQKELALFRQNIKPLALFFIPNIADFRGENPFIKNEFERLYRLKRTEILASDLPQDYRDYLARDIDENGDLRVAQGYFSGDAKITGAKNAENQEAADIAMILNDKEKLLSLNTPLRFIFSVWALQEGWDNPNIFTLTKLAASASDTSRHQQIGRGLRLAVDDAGQRITHKFMRQDDAAFYEINSLDIIISGHERNFIEGLQSEIDAMSLQIDTITIDGLKSLGFNDAETITIITHLLSQNAIAQNSGVFDICGDIPQALQSISGIDQAKLAPLKESFKPNANKNEQVGAKNTPKTQIKIRQNLAAQFKELWQSINRTAKICYKNINAARLTQEIATQFNAAAISPEQIYFERRHIDPATNRVVAGAAIPVATQEYLNLEKDIKTLLFEFSKDHAIPLNFLLKLFKKLDFAKFQASPKTAFKKLAQIYQTALHAHLLASVGYEFADYSFTSADLLYTAKGVAREFIDKERFAAKNYEPSGQNDKFLFDALIYDSALEKEVITEAPTSEISVFAKLPSFKIQTAPNHFYEPDFAYLIKTKSGQKIFFICETKGVDTTATLRESEKQKIAYAKRFFAALDRDLAPQGVRVKYRTRINKENLIAILNEITKDQK